MIVHDISLTLVLVGEFIKGAYFKLNICVVDHILVSIPIQTNRTIHSIQFIMNRPTIANKLLDSFLYHLNPFIGKEIQ